MPQGGSSIENTMFSNINTISNRRGGAPSHMHVVLTPKNMHTRPPSRFPPAHTYIGGQPSMIKTCL